MTYQPKSASLRPIHAEAGIYTMVSPLLDDYAKDVLDLLPGQHVLKIGKTTNFDCRRSTVAGRNDYNVHDAEAYFGMTDWTPAKFRRGDEADVGRAEDDAHAALDHARLSLDEAAVLHMHVHKVPYGKATRPELFKLNLADLTLLQLFPRAGNMVRRPKHGERYSRRIIGGF